MARDRVVVTAGGKLPFRIVHLAVPNSNNSEEWKDAVNRALRAAEDAGITSLSIPAIGIGRINSSLINTYVPVYTY